MAAACPMCGATVDWVTAATAARILDVTEGRVRALLSEGRFPNAVKYEQKPGHGGFWKIPLADVAALIEIRRNG